MKTNKERVVKQIEKLGYVLGVYDNGLDLLNERWIKKVVNSIGDDGDVLVYLNRKKYVVELHTVDNEIDLIMYSKEEYISRYGDEFFREE